MRLIDETERKNKAATSARFKLMNNQALLFKMLCGDIASMSGKSFNEEDQKLLKTTADNIDSQLSLGSDGFEKIRTCDDCLNWDIQPSGTWCRHSFATNLRNAGVDINYISESMGHSMPDHSVTELYIDHYPLAKQMEYNSLLLDIKSNMEQKRAKIMNYLSSLSLEELEDIMRDRQDRMKAALTYRDRNCTFSLTLDKRTNKKSNDTYPLSVRFTIDRKSYYHHVGSDYSVEAYEQIRDAKDDSEYMEDRRHWDELMTQYEYALHEVTPGHTLTLDAIKTKLNP